MTWVAAVVKGLNPGGLPPLLVTLKICDSANWPVLWAEVLKALMLYWLPGEATKLSKV